MHQIKQKLLCGCSVVCFAHLHHRNLHPICARHQLDSRHNFKHSNSPSNSKSKSKQNRSLTLHILQTLVTLRSTILGRSRSKSGSVS